MKFTRINPMTSLAEWVGRFGGKAGFDSFINLRWIKVEIPDGHCAV